MMFGGDDDVFHPGLFGHANPLVGVELHRIELWEKLGVSREGNLQIVHEPLAGAAYGFAIPFAGCRRIKSEVNKHPEPGFAPPGHAIVILEGAFAAGCRSKRGKVGRWRQGRNVEWPTEEK